MMTIGEVSQFLTALCALGALAASLRNRNAIKEVHLTLNSRLDELIETTKAASLAEGFKQGREESDANYARNTK